MSSVLTPLLYPIGYMAVKDVEKMKATIKNKTSN